MYSLEIDADREDHDLLIAELWEQGSAGIVELDARRVRAFFDDSVDRESLRALYPGAAWRTEEDRDWVAAARALLPPMLVGERFHLVPEWRDDPTPVGRLRITVNPGLAFGTGFHETTQLCLEALEQHVRPGMSVLDVGTGSGILAQAAALLGASPVWACDSDSSAIEVARRKLPHAFVGSAESVRGGSAGLVVANISPHAILALAPHLLRALAPRGTALLSGFEVQDVDRLRAALPGVRDVRTKQSWALIVV